MKNKSNKIIVGTWGLSGDLGKIKENPLNIFYKAIELGFNEFDIAPTYGQGKIYNLLKKIPYKIKNNMIFNTKCGYDEKIYKKTFSIKDIKRSVENSLDILGKINVLYIHNPRNEIKNWEKIINLINNLKKKKFIKYSGISFAKNFYFEEKIVNNFDYIQDEINLLTANNYNKIKKYNCRIHSRSPFALGLLVNKNNIKFQNNDYRKNLFSSEEREKIILSQISNLKIIDSDLKKLSLDFLFSLKKIDKIIFGIKTTKHLIELKNNLKIIKKISQNKKEKVFKLNKNFFNFKFNFNLLY